MDILNIEFSDKSKSTIVIPYRSHNVSTSLTLPGEKTVEYGYDINTNFLRLLEHFADVTPPINSIKGQLWFNSSEDTMYVQTGADAESSMVPLGYTKPHEVPDGAYTREIVLGTLAKYLSINGGHVTGPLLLKDVSDLDHINCAVPKSYVDSLVPVNPGYIPLSGNTTPATGTIFVPAVAESSDATHDSIAANKKYADDTVPQVSIQYTKEVSINKTAVGHISIVIFKPSKLINMFGAVTMQTTDNEFTIPLASYLEGSTKIRGIAIHVNTAGEQNLYTTVDARTNGTNAIIRKHGAGAKPTTVHFTINGVLL
jgi:hypothetical protein